MPFRFRRSIKIAPGLRLNVGKRGMSVSAGVRGAHVTFGSNGTRVSAGIPGTGLSHTTYVRNSSGVAYDSATGLPLTRAQVNAEIRRRHKAEQMRGAQAHIDHDQMEYEKFTNSAAHSPQLLGDEHWEKELTMRPFSLMNYGLDFPKLNYLRKKYIFAVPGTFWKQPFFYIALVCLVALLYVAANFQTTAGSFAYWGCQIFRGVFFLQIPLSFWWFSKACRAAWLGAKSEFSSTLEKVNHLQAAHPQVEQERIAELKKLMAGEREKLETSLSVELQAFSDEVAANEHSCELKIEFEIVEDGEIFLDVDLPEIEDVVQTEVKTVLKSGQISAKVKNKKTQSAEYARGVLGIAFSVAARAFNVSPAIKKVTVSGHTLRVNKGTGNSEIQYIYSARFPRVDFSKLELKNIDPVDAFSGFENHLDLNQNFDFKIVSPFETSKEPKSA